MLEVPEDFHSLKSLAWRMYRESSRHCVVALLFDGWICRHTNTNILSGYAAPDPLRWGYHSC
jgi:hypothetical protein